MISTRVIKQVDGNYRVESVNEDGTIRQVELSRDGDRTFDKRERAIELAAVIFRRVYAAANPPVESTVWSSAEMTG
jgi:hypothetical protein